MDRACVSTAVNARRFYARPEDCSTREIVLRDDEAHHAERVLRLRPGTEVVCFDGAGRSWRARIDEYARRAARLTVLEHFCPEPTPNPGVTLAQGFVKGDRMDFILQKATELGVVRFLPLVCDHSDVRLDDARSAKRQERWRRIAIEAAKQCERASVPEILPPASVDDVLAGLDETSIAFVERGGAPVRPTLDALLDSGALEQSTLFVGPEGGWSSREKTLFAENLTHRVSLGRRILRADTAAIVGLALVVLAE